MKRLKKFITLHRSLLTIALVSYSLSTIASFFFFDRVRNPHYLPVGSPTVLSAEAQEPVPQEPNVDHLNVLLVGFGGPGHQGGYLADVIQVAHFDFDRSLLAFISIPRDLWVQLPSGLSNKLNAAFSIDVNNQDNQGKIISSPTLSSSISKATGLPIDYFIGIDFVGFQRAIGYELDGIEVQVTQILDDPWYPIRGLEQEPCGYTQEEIADLTSRYSGFELESQFPCRYEHIYFEPGTHHMEGHETLAFVRSRHSSSDFDRSARQQAVLQAIKDKLISLDSLKNLPQTFSQFTTHIHTDLDKDIINSLAPAIRSIPNLKVITINLSTDNVLTTGTSNTGAFILTPKKDWQAVQQFISNQLSND